MRARTCPKTTRAAVFLACAVACCAVTAGRVKSASADPPAAPAGVSIPAAVRASALEKVTGRSNGTALVHMLGPRAAQTLAPNSGMIGALVAIPRGKTAQDYGLDPIAPGIGRLRAPPARIEEFGFAHPELRLEVAPPLHPTLDRAGQWVLADVARRQQGADGAGVMVGVADTGLDVTNPEMLTARGKTRVAWMLDLSLKPVGVHADIEANFSLKNSRGELERGAVLSNDMIDALLKKFNDGSCDEASGEKCAPSDEIGHGTHVTGIAAARGSDDGKYAGIAPAADIVFCRFTRGMSEAIEPDDVALCVKFMFDRAAAEKRPMVVNLSVGSDFGPHDGTLLWEQAIASHVGAQYPGRAIIASAGNSGSITEMPIHQSVRATKGATMRVPIRTAGAAAGSVQVWITLRAGADLKIGLDGPNEEWIAPVEEGHQNGKNTDEYNAGVIYGRGLEGSPIPEGSRGAVVVWTGKWPAGPYAVTFEGTGMADLWVQGLGDASLGAIGQAVFAHGVREGTINLPATHPDIIAVGCTVNRKRWTSIGNADVSFVRVPLLDEAGGLPVPHSKTQPSSRELAEGEVCWFSSAGPTVTGAPKPEISAPGAFVISSLSRTAKPGASGSVFTNASCPSTKTGKPDARCMQIDDSHGVAVGTSMSSPVVAGVVALLLQKDPTLTQDKILALLQGGAHRFRTATPFDDQGGPGEVDAMGALDALEQMNNPTLQLPAFDQSWVTLSSDYVPADGSTPVTAIVELRTADAAHRADFFDKTRIAAVLRIDGQPFDGAPEIIRRGPGVWFFVWKPPSGLGGSRATFGATFDGVPIVAPRTIPIASDRWNAVYPSQAAGSGCTVGVHAREAGTTVGAATAIVLGLAISRRRRRSTREEV